MVSLVPFGNLPPGQERTPKRRGPLPSALYYGLDGPFNGTEVRITTSRDVSGAKQRPTWELTPLSTLEPSAGGTTSRHRLLFDFEPPV